MKKIFAMIALISLGFSAMATFRQNPNWTILPNQVKFSYTSSAPTSSSITAPSGGVPAGAQNGAYDESGNLLFYVVAGNVYNASGVSVGTLPTASYMAYINPQYQLINVNAFENNEIAIVPVPGTCRSYYIIYAIDGQPYGMPSTSFRPCLMYTTVTWTSGGVSVTPTSNLYFNTYSGGGTIVPKPAQMLSYDQSYTTSINGPNTGLAVSRAVSGSGATTLRNLFWVTPATIYEFTISASGIVPSSTPIAGAQLSGHQNGLISEVDMDYPTGNSAKLAWGDRPTTGTAELCLLTINSGLGSGNNPANYPLPAGNYQIYGQEFDAYGNIYVSSTLGIYKWAVATGTFTLLSGSSSYNSTQLETGSDGNNDASGNYINNIYAVSSAGKLGVISPIGSTIAASSLSSVTVSSSISYSGLYGTIYTLPDQIDGDQYVYFNGVPQAQAAFKINGTNLVSSSCSSPLQVNNCTSIALTNQTTGAVSYTIAVNSIDNSCNIISGTPYLAYNSGSITTLPTDLRSMPGTNGNWLALYAGLYQITITASNGCSSPTSQTGIIYVSGTPNATLFLNSVDASNVTVTSSGSLASGQIVAGDFTSCLNAGVSFNIQNSTGNITQWWKEVDEKISGTFVSQYSGGPYTSSLPTLSQALCGSCINNGNEYKLIIKLSNSCVSSPITISQLLLPNTACKTDILNGVSNVDGASGNSVTVYPVPVEEATALHISLVEPSQVSASLIDMEGRVVQVLAESKSMPQGETVLTINTALLQPGVYLYKVTAGGNNYSGRVVKAE
jgi:hypothetical protein